MSERAQTGMDFLVGMTVFLIAVGFVFAFVPTMFDPFTGHGVDDDLVADRSAAQLAEDTLVSHPTTPNLLETTETEAFFETCPIESELGIDGRNARIAIGSGDDPAVVNGTALTCGEEPPPGASVSISQRLVSIGGENHRLTVEVW
ncbi:DUF7287 family protein [Halalkalicoccus jeotgali]|uniref:Uncharacterized protein n=1 Tax=Halalkalicoccus jeotgali (strain DSM 18796 / CECT 7217 / JCM 14584 / KCTC 4019 / B3) TaxID=795797 RepID=D8J4V0_HALJB|nr:hypothetical protein [Halalkalicoccus jeotgali]ADJ15567.1 hypothetical protein HacjB3_10920 [Halalkalicoccus jeotgali B3]ELY36025.1 hypothetical protein C497_11752 [Halalkalicoccus jeotgali B3]